MRTLPQILRVSFHSISLHSFRRTLFTEESLGIKAFDQWSEERRKQCGITCDEFKARMIKYLPQNRTTETTSIILSEDLKNFIAFNCVDIDYEALCKIYYRQTVELCISPYPFTVVLMKFLYKTKQIDLAIKLLKDGDLSSMFDQLSSYQLCMDQLFKFKRYDNVVSLFNYFQQHSKIVNSMPYPRSLLILLYASLYEINTTESLEKAINLYKSIHRNGCSLPRRALCFLVDLCYRNGRTELAYELLSTVNCDEFLLGRCLKIRLLTKLGRTSEIAYILERLILSDLSTDSYEDNELSVDVVENLEKIALNSDESHKFNDQLKLLRRGGHIINMTVEELLKSSVALAPTFGSSNDSVAEVPLDERTVKALPSSDLSREKLKLLSYSNETLDLDDVKSFTLTEKKRRRKELLFEKFAENVVKEGPFAV